MNCKYMNMLRVVRGNAFKLKIAVEAYTPSGRRIDSFALGEAVLKLDKNGTLTTKEYTILEGTTILVAFDGSDSLGVYGFQMSGEYEGEAWRWANAEIFQIVESNVKANIPDGCVLLDDTYNMALKIVLSGGDGITFTPSVSEQGIISWTNDGGLPNPEPRNIRGHRGEQGPQGEVGPQGPRGQMGLRGQIGPKGDKGDKGDTGATPVLDVTASVDENVGNPMVVVESFGPAEHRTFDFQFKNLKGQKGETGATGPQGPQGQQGEPGNYTKPASGIPLSDLNGNVASGIVYDVTANNSGATFASLSALLSSGSLSTLIPTDVRKGGMQIRFVCSSDNKYVQYRLLTTSFSTEPSDWISVEEWADNSLAKKDGYYETLGAGTATNLKGQNIVNGEFVYRKSGGNDAVATGAAFLEGLKGKTLAWNQLADNSHFPDATRAGVLWSHDTDGILTANGTANADEVISGWLNLPVGTIASGHKILVLCRLLSGSITGTFGCDYSMSTTTKGASVLSSPFITTAASNQKSTVFYSSGTIFNNAKLVFNYIDLTLIYGTGNEPSSVAQFEADYFRWFGNPLTYEAYDAGSLRSVKMSALKTVGFNQLNTLGRTAYNGYVSIGPTEKKIFKETEYWNAISTNGYYVPYANNKQTNVVIGEGSVSATGVNAAYGIGFPIKCLPNTTYYIKYNSANSEAGVGFYDKDGIYISHRNNTNTTFTTPPNCEWIVVVVGKYVGDYSCNNICINISDANKNGTYKEYDSHSLSVPVTTMTGKVNGEGSSEIVFPNGMLSVGDVKDEIYIQGGKTYGVVKNGKQTVNGAIGDTITLVGCDTSATTFICGQDIGTLSGGVLTLTAAASNVDVVYKLATPIVYELDDFTLPAQFLVDALGTEEIIPVTGEVDVAPTLALRYGVNAVGTIQNLPKGYISEGSMDDFLSSLGAAMGGTWTKTWNATTNKYDFSFTANT